MELNVVNKITLYVPDSSLICCFRFSQESASGALCRVLIVWVVQQFLNPEQDLLQRNRRLPIVPVGAKVSIPGVLEYISVECLPQYA